MEKKELRIGNLVSWGLGVHEWELYNYNDHDLDYAKPIPLTEEWLLKFGFDEITPKYYVLNIDENNSFTYYYTFSGGFWHFEFEGISIKIKYVHQLQNLYFALTGEELTIK